MLGGMARLIGALTRRPPLADHGPWVERYYSSPHSDGHDSNPRHPKRYDYRTRRGERDDEEQRTQNFPGAQGPVQVCLAEFAENRTFERSSLHSDGHDSNPRHPKRYDYRPRRGDRGDEEQLTQNFPGAQGPVQVCLAEFAENRTFERSSLRLPNARPCRLT